MAFFGIPGVGKTQRFSRAEASDEFLHRHGCAACPLNNQPGLSHPHMAPTGAEHPDAYLLGEAPGADEDRRGEQFVGSAGAILRRRIPAKWLPRIRFNNVVRTRPPKNRTPARVEVEACRPSIEADISQADPRAILGFGNVALGWAGISDSGIRLWAGRRAPIMVGSRALWYFPIVHPSAIQRDPTWRGAQRSPDRYGSELEFQFARHVRQALAAIDAGLPEPVVHTPEMAEAGVEWVMGDGGDADVRRVEKFLAGAAAQKFAGLDYETSCLRPYEATARILTAAVSTKRGTLAFPLDHREAKWGASRRKVIDEIWEEFLYESACRKLSHNLTFEMEWSAFFYGADCLRATPWGDSVSQAYILDERPGGHSLDFLCMQYFGFNIKKLAGVRRDNLDAEPLPRVLRYNGMDAKYHRLLYAAQARALREAGLGALYASHLERVPTAVLTQLKGIPIDQGAVLELGKKYAPAMIEAERALRALPAVKEFERARSQQFRPSANEDVKGVINGVLGHDLPNVDEAALETIDHEFVKLELAWRGAAKVYGTYVMPVANEETREALEKIRRDGLAGIGGVVEDKAIKASRVFPDGFLHPQTNVNRTRTSRTSSDEPNYQNWPKRSSADAVEVRRVAKPRSGEVVVSFDFGQIQARNVGMESLDEALLRSFWEDHDIHEDFMRELVRLYPRWVKEGVRALHAEDKAGEKLRKVYRNNVKHGFVFASFFGATARKTSSVLGVPQRVAEDLHAIFEDRFGGIHDWHQRLESDYYRTGYVTGHSGYRRRAPCAYNERINAPIQADEAAIVLDAMTRLSKIDNDRLQASMEIHDDLEFIWEKGWVDELAPIVIREMLAVPFKWAQTTPIVVEMELGPDWGSLRAPAEHVFASNRYDGIDMPRSCPLWTP